MSQPPYQGGPGYPPPGGPNYPQSGPGPAGPGYPPPGPGQPGPNTGYGGGPGYPPVQGGPGFQQAGPMVDRSMVTTGIEFGGYKITRYMGLVRGLTVRSRSVIGNIGAGFQSLVGGKITIYVELCEKAREEAFDLMMQHAAQMGANAVIGMRYDANEVADGITEVLAYGTAVVVEPTAK